MRKNSSTIYIKAKVRRHRYFTLLLGASLLTFSLLFAQWFWLEARLVLIFAIMVSVVALFIGLMKWLEPDYSLKLTKKRINYRHRYGRWYLFWEQVKRFGPINQTLGIEQLQLPYIGIQLKNSEVMRKQITTRLANRLLHEQRPLLSHAVQHELLTMEQATMNFEPYLIKSTSGKTIKVKGPVAAYLYQQDLLLLAYGYHLYIPETALDRDIDEFLLLLNQCKSHR